VRITIVVGPFYPVPTVLGGAVEKVHLLLAQAYRDAGHQVTIVSRRYKDFRHDEVTDGIRHIRIPSSDRSSNLAINLVLDFIYAVRVARALPYSDLTISTAFSVPLLLPRRRAGKIYVQIGRHPKGQMFIYFRADRLQAVSKAVAQAIARQAPWLKSKICVIGYAIPDAFFARRAGGRAEQVVLYVGRIAREKGIELLLRAFAQMRSRPDQSTMSAWRLRLVGPHAIAQGGDGPEYFQQLQELARELDIRCDFVAPIFEQNTLIGEYQRGSIFVYPSLAETGESFGLAPLEAMAAGCATIVSDLRCFDDYIVDGTNGLKFEHRAANPVENLADKLIALIRDPKYLQRIAEAGRAAASQFSVARIAERMMEEFNRVVDAG